MVVLRLVIRTHHHFTAGRLSGVSTLPVAYDSIPNCVNNFILNAPVAGEGDQSTSLCFTPDEELSSCNTLYQQCILNPVTICIEEATGIDDPDLIYVGGNYYYPQETTVTVRADGIWNPTTNQYQVNNYLSYTVTPVIDGISQPHLHKLIWTERLNLKQLQTHL